uniref:Uncharacterized protein n=1 Tax=Anguilla anguilla TaxID=7936 RepID=A0A0E9PWZ5_ANGAN
MGNYQLRYWQVYNVSTTNVSIGHCYSLL